MEFKRCFHETNLWISRKPRWKIKHSGWHYEGSSVVKATNEAKWKDEIETGPSVKQKGSVKNIGYVKTGLLEVSRCFTEANCCFQFVIMTYPISSLIVNFVTWLLSTSFFIMFFKRCLMYVRLKFVILEKIRNWIYLFFTHSFFNLYATELENPWIFFKSSHTCLKCDKKEGYITRCMSHTCNSYSTNFMDRCLKMRIPVTENGPSNFSLGPFNCNSIEINIPLFR